MRSVLVALWLALLFLPFKGPKAASILFAIVLIIVSSWTHLKRCGRTLREKGFTRINALRAVSLSGKRLSLARCGLLLFLIVAPFFAGDYVLDVAILCGIYIILALGLNVVVGFTGLLNLGFAAFYAIGAYSYALLNVRLGLGFWESLPLCLMITTISGFVLAVPALRLRGDYLAIVTLGFGEIIRLILNNWDSFTNGPNGISGIAPPRVSGLSLGGLDKYYYVTLAAVFFSYIVVKRVRSSKLGRAWIAMREDEIGASSVGINITVYKLYSFAFGAFWAGVAGALFAAKMRFVSPDSFTFMESVLMLCMVILGGLGSIAGVTLGAVVLVALPEALREVQSYRMLALGAGLILMMIFRPQGLFGGARR